MSDSKDSHKNNSGDDGNSNTFINTFFKKDKFHHHIYSSAFVMCLTQIVN